MLLLYKIDLFVFAVSKMYTFKAEHGQGYQGYWKESNLENEIDSLVAIMNDHLNIFAPIGASKNL